MPEVLDVLRHHCHAPRVAPLRESCGVLKGNSLTSRRLLRATRARAFRRDYYSER